MNKLNYLSFITKFRWKILGRNLYLKKISLSYW